MRKRIICCATILLGAGLVGQVLSNGRTDDPLGVAVSPQTLILHLDQGGAVTVHTAIKLAVVDSNSLTLNGVPAEGVWADSRGNVVARFSEAAIEALVAPPSAVLTLEGGLKDGTPFAGSDEVQVIE
jgi:hypothetical protein